MMLLGESKGVITLDITDLSAKSAAAASQLSALEASTAGAFGSLDGQLKSAGSSASAFGKGMIGMGAAMLVPIAMGVKEAANLEQAFADVNASLTRTERESGVMERLEKLIIDVGSAGQFSAIQMAAVTEELIKTGYTADQIIGNNMTKAVSDLASATGDSLPVAVNAITTSMALWSEQVVGTTLAITDASDAADILTIAANASKVGVADISSGLKNLGPQAALAGISMQDTVAAIAGFANFGLPAREAGTSLTRALVELSTPTSKASKLMNELGIEAFNSAGKFIGFPALMDQLKVSMSDMSDETKFAALSLIFGSEAMDVMGLSILTGGDLIRDITAQMTDWGIASDQAELRTKTLQGAFERLSEGFTVFLALLAGGLVGPMTMAANALDFFIGLIASIPMPILHAVGILMTLTGTFLIVGGTAILMAPKITAFMQTLRMLAATQGPLTGLASAMLNVGRAARFMIPIFGLIGLAVGGAVLAYRNNFLGFADTLRGQFGGLFKLWDDLTAKTEVSTSEATKSFNGMVETVHNSTDAVGGDTTAWFYTELDENGVPQRIGQIIESLPDEDGDGRVQVKIKTDDGDYWAWIDRNTGEIVGETTVEIDVQEKKKGKLQIISEYLTDLQSRLSQGNHPYLAGMVGWANKAVTGISSLGEHFSNLGWRIDLFSGLFNTLRDSGQGFFEALGNSLERVFYKEIAFAKRIPDMVRGAISAIPGIVDSVFKGAMNFGRWTLDVGIPRVKGWLKKAGKTAWDGMTDAADWAWKKGLKIKRWTLDTAAPRVKGWLRRAGDTVWDGISSAAGWGRSQIASLKRWSLDVARPTITGWMGTAKDSAFGFLASAAGFAQDTVKLANWALDVGMPKLRGWITTAGDTIWDFITSAAGIAGGMVASLAGWVLETTAPTVSGWLSTAKNAVWDAVSAAAGWVGTMAATVGSWTLDVPSPTDVLGWIDDFMDDPWGEIKTAILGEDGTFEVTLDGWTLQIDEPDLDSALEDFDAWFTKKTGISPGDLIVRVRDWTLDVGVPRTIKVTQALTTLIADFIGGVGVTLKDVVLSVLFSRDLIILGFDVDKIIEDSLGYIAEQGIDVLIDILWAFKNDPKQSLIRLLALTFLSGLVLTVGVSGLAMAIMPVALVAAGIMVYNQLRDYFARNPGKIDELKLEIGKIWGEFEDGKFGIVFVGIRKIGEALVFVVEKASAFNDWLNGLPGPFGDAARAARNLTIALIALQAVSVMGGFTPGGAKGKKGGKGFIGGLLSGMWMLLAFPFRLLFNPVGTLKKLFSSKAGGAGGGSRSWIQLAATQLWRLAKAPFVAIAAGFRGLMTGVRAFGTGFSRAMASMGGVYRHFHPVKAFFRAFGRGMTGVLKSILHAPNFFGKFLRSVGSLGKGVATLGKTIVGAFWNIPTRQLGSRIIGGLYTVFTKGFAGIARLAMGFGKGFTSAIVSGLKGLFTVKLGIISNPKAFAAFSKITDGLAKAFGKLRGPLRKVWPLLRKMGPLFSRMGPAARLLLSPILMIGRAIATALVPALLAMGPPGWIVLGIIALIIAAIALWKTNLFGFRDHSKNAIEGVVGIFNRLKDAWKADGFTGLVKELWDVYTDAFNGLSNIVSDGLSWVGDRIWDGLSAIGGWIGEKAGDIWDGFTDAVSNAWETASGWFGGLGAKVAAKVGDAWRWLRDKGSSLISGFMGAVRTAWTTAQGWFSDLKGKVTSRVGDAWSWIRDKGKSLIDGFMGAVRSAWTTAQGWFSDLKGKVTSRIGDAWSWIRGKGKSLIDGFMSAVRTAWTGAVGWFSDLKGKVTSKVGDAWSWIRSRGSSLIDGFMSAVRTAWTRSVDWFSDLKGKITGKVGSLYDTLQGKARQMISGFVVAIVGKWDDVTDWFSGIGDLITGAITSPETILTDAGGLLMGGLRAGMEAGLSAVQDLITGIVDYVIEKINMLIGAINAVTNIASEIPGVNVPKIEPIQTSEEKAFNERVRRAQETADRIREIFQKPIQGKPLTDAFYRDWFENGDKYIQDVLSDMVANNTDPDSVAAILKEYGRNIRERDQPELPPPIDPKGAPTFSQQPMPKMSTEQIVKYAAALDVAQRQALSQAVAQQTAFKQINAAFMSNFKPISAGFSQTPQTWYKPTNTALVGVQGAFKTQLAPVAPIARTAFSNAKVGAVGQTTSMSTGVIGGVRVMSGGVSTGMKGMSGTAIGQAKTMQGGVTNQTSRMASTTGNNTGKMASFAQSNGGKMSSTLTTASSRAAAGVQTNIGRIPRIITSVGGQAVGAARSVGISIGEGLARGLESQLGRVRAAAAAIVAAANVAAAAEAGVRSPSRVWIYYGQMMVAGLVNALERYGPLATPAAQKAMDAALIGPGSLANLRAIPVMPASLASTAPHWMAPNATPPHNPSNGGNGVTYNSSNNIYVTQREGESGTALAYRVIDILNGGEGDAGE